MPVQWLEVPRVPRVAGGLVTWVRARLSSNSLESSSWVRMWVTRVPKISEDPTLPVVGRCHRYELTLNVHSGIGGSSAPFYPAFLRKSV